MSTRSSSLVCSPTPICDSQAATNPTTVAASNPRLIELMKSLYQADQQAKYLHLQAEVESLLQQLETLKQQRLASVKPDAANQG